MIILILFISGCASSIDNMKDDRFTVGCAVVEANIKLGYFNQEGNAEACKLVCSDKLPENFTYFYESRGCTIEIGKK